MQTTTTEKTSRRIILDQAAKIAAAMVYVESPSCLHSQYSVRSLAHGGVMFWAMDQRAAERKMIRFGIASLRLGKTLPGVHKRNAGILGECFPAHQDASHE